MLYPKKTWWINKHIHKCERCIHINDSGPIFKYVVIQKVAKATIGIRVLTREISYLLYSNKKHGGLTNMSKNVRGAFKSMTLGPIFKYVVIQKVAKATKGIRFLTC